jgi:LemA protein
MEQIARARAQVLESSTDIRTRATAEAKLGTAARSLLAVTETYPELRANQNLLAVQEQLSTTENRIAFARQFYNECAMKYNIARRTFPTSLFATALGFSAAEMFHLDDPGDGQAPTIRVQP